MMTTEQEERLLGQVAKGVSLETAMDSLGISDLDLHMRAQSDEAFEIALRLVVDVRDEFTKALFKELDSE